MRNIVKRGDIFWYNFKEKEGSLQRGLRPVVVVQNNVGNKFSPTVIVAVITSQIKNNQPTQVNIKNYEEAGLKTPSKILTEQLKTIDKSFLLDYIGRLDSNTMKDLDKALVVSIGTVSTKPKWVEMIEKKVKRINFKELQIYDVKVSGYSNGGYYEKLNNELKEMLGELKYICSQRGVDYKGFYTSYEEMRKVI